MNNVSVVVGALIAGIVGGSLFAVGVVARPSGTLHAPMTVQSGGPAVVMPPVVPGMGPMHGGPAAIAPEVPKPGAVTASGAVQGEPQAKSRQSAEGLVPLSQPRIEAPIPQRGPTLVKYEVETREVTALMDDGVAYTYWTFGGTVPGPMLRVRQGDTVELTLQERRRQQGHPQHRPARRDRPGRRRQGDPGRPRRDRPPSASRRSTRASTSTTARRRWSPHHIASGMYGLIVVEPPEGLPQVDHEFYVMQGDFYLEGDRGEKGLHDFAIDEDARRAARLRGLQRRGRRADRRQRAQGEGRRDGPHLLRRRRPEPHLQLPRHRRDLRPGLSGGGDRPSRRRTSRRRWCRPAARRSSSSRSTTRAPTSWSTTASGG